MRYLIIGDIHANLPAAKAALHAAKTYHVDTVVHLGDAISVGPWPSEVLDVFLGAGVVMLKGNHEEDVFIDPERRAHLPDGEKAHIAWMKQQLGPERIEQCRKMPYQYIPHSSVRIQHFPLNLDGFISSQIGWVEQEDLCKAFDRKDENLIIFGHIHRRSESIQDGCKFISFGASGFQKSNGEGAEALILDIDEMSQGVPHTTTQIRLEWKSDLVRKEMELRNVPTRDVAWKELFA